ncbi:CHAT domain-containing protein [Planktothrix sp. FACHB-1365]|uniref:CHAT domain-containing protein n=1 Tax=Planktothrix sp. FACHB-1365 TaxID=2692855 RepID=UPI0018EF832C|nr:CHAT domain-containing protein [Planktothrix sp. FACHB-1365]
MAILGNDDGINVEADRNFLNSIPGAKVEFLVKPNRQELNDQLWEQSWDILFFAGHSRTEGETGILYINKTESLTIPDLRYALKKAIEKGLQLAIFNSCDGLGLAQDLADLNLPQMIVMREPVPDKVAQEFLKYFLGSFSGGQSFYLAVKEARERLQGLESHFPCASWLPVICQNVAKLPPTWIELQATQHYSDRDSSLLQPENDNEYKPPLILSKNNILSGLTQWLQKKYTRIADNQSITKLPEYCPCCGVSINYTNYAHKYVINWDEDKREFRVELFLRCVYDGYELHHLLKRLPLSIAQDSFCSCGSKLSLSNHTIRRSGDEFEFEGIYICLVCRKEQRRIFNDLKRRIYNSWKNINSIEIRPTGVKYKQ